MTIARSLAEVSIEDLYWSLNANLEHISAHRRVIAEGGMTMRQIDAYSRAVQEDVATVRLIVAELRRRGEQVDWEE